MKSAPYTGFVAPEYIEPTICFTTDKNYNQRELSLRKVAGNAGS